MSDLDSYKQWTPAAQERALAALQARKNESWRPFFCGDRTCNGKPHGVWEWNHGRGDQYPPADADWLTWAITSGRGAGKTRTGSELTHQMTEVTGRIALIAATGPDVRDVMLEGESGILTIARPDRKPKFEPSKRRLTWPNGCIATTFSAEEPDRLRGPEHGFAWLDEPAHWALIQDCWDNIMFGLRIGTRPRALVTTTPKPRPWMKELLKDPRTRHTVTSTYANLDNLAPTFAETVIAKYEGTRLGRQELHGEVLEDVEGALWQYEMIEPDRVASAPHFDQVIVVIDPAGSVRPTSDETGILVIGRTGDHCYPFVDRTGRYTPHGWATIADELYELYSGDAIVAEDNYGGDMVEANLRSVGITKKVHRVKSRRGKAIRAEPVVALYEQHKVHHVGILADLETEMCEWQPYEPNSPSPNRVDCLVHGCTFLMKRRLPADIASPAQLRRRDLPRHYARPSSTR